MALTTTPSELTATALTLTTAAQPNITSVGTLTALTGGTGDLIWDTNTLVVDSSTDRVGIGTATPLAKLDFGATSTTQQVIYLRQNGTSRTSLGISSQYGVRVAGPSDAAATGNVFEVGQNLASDGTTFQNTRFAVQYDGKVGIADTTPAEKLSVTGAILSEGDHATGVNAMGAAAGILMHATGDTAYITATSNGNNHRYLSLRALNTGAANAHQVFLSYTGNVGIGTNTPGNTFVVKGAASTSPILEMINSDAEDNNTGRESTIRFSGFRSGGEAMINGQITGTHLDSGDDDKGGLTFFSNNGSGIAERMRLDQWGRLGIGTDSPIAGLSVKATSANQNTYLIHAYRPDGLSHAAEPFSSILIQNQETTAGYQYDGMTIMASHQAHLRFQTGNTGAWGGTGAKRWQLRMGIGNNVDQLSVYSWTAATEVLTMNTSGATLLKSVGANYALQVGTGHGNYGTGALNSSYQHTVVISGPTNFYWGNPCYASGGFSTYSDEKLKKEITLIPDALTKVKKMKGVSFKWIDADKRGGARVGKQFGVTAQNMLEIDSELPELSVDPLAEEGKEESSEKYYTMDYTRITPFLIEAIKEQQTLIETLQTKVAALEAK